MATFTIFYGSSTPMKAVGKNQVRLLQFAEKYRGWHSYKEDRATLKALMALKEKGYLEVNMDTKQFQFKYPDQ